MKIDPTLSHPLRGVFALATGIGVNLLKGLETTYPQEQVSEEIAGKCGQ